MNHSEIEKVVDDIAQIMVFVDWSDPQTLEGLPERFGDLAAILRDTGHEVEADHVVGAAGVAGQLLAGGDNEKACRDYLTQMLNVLQVCLNGDCSCAEAEWPDAVNPSTADSGKTAAAPSGPVSLVDDEIMGEFLARQADTLDEVEKELLNIECGACQGDREGINRFFHTLKGESALLDLHDVAAVCHATEDMMQAVELDVCIDQLLAVKDWFIATFRHLRHEGPPPAPVAEILASLQLAQEDQPGPAEQVAATDDDLLPEYEVVDYTSLNVLACDLDLVQDFVEEAVEHLDAAEGHLLTLEANPKETEALNAVFRGFHTIKGLAGFIEMNHIKDLAHKAENLLDMARREELELVGTNMDLVFESVDVMKRLIDGVVAAMGADGTMPKESGLAPLMGRLVRATSGEDAAAPAPVPDPDPDPEPESTEAPVIKGFVPLAKMAKNTAAEPSADTSGPESAAPASGPKANAPAKMKEAMRVDAERLDHLIETIGELVIAESMVSQSPEIQNATLSVKLAKDLDHLDKICRELQEIGMSLRMIPVRPVFQKMARLVRDLAKKQNRQVEFVMIGEDTELDKNVVDKIGDPLVHMIRNAVDHGIESDPAERVALCKPEQGRVELRAFHKGGNICIEIEDDGRGLDKDAIKAKAISRGLLREGEVISDRDLYLMIFEPGFSTAKEVTDISGRGVGMDVVRRNIEELRGTVDITSEKGEGTTFSIRLPLTLAIIEGMVIMVGREHYIVPTLSVVRLIRPAQKDISHVFDRGEMLTFEGNQLPLFRLSRLFDVEAALTAPHEAMVVIVEDEGRQIGLVADQLLGQQSIVIKSLGDSMQGTDGIAGGAIMSDGNVALILDVAGLVRVAHTVDSSVVLTDAPSAATLDTEVAPSPRPETPDAESQAMTDAPEDRPVLVEA